MNRSIDFNRSKLAVFASYIAPHRGAFALDMCLSLAVALVDLAFPYVTRHTMNTLLPQKQFAAFFSVMALLFAAFILLAVYFAKKGFCPALSFALFILFTVNRNNAAIA